MPLNIKNQTRLEISFNWVQTELNFGSGRTNHNLLCNCFLTLSPEIYMGPTAKNISRIELTWRLPKLSLSWTQHASFSCHLLLPFRYTPKTRRNLGWDCGRKQPKKTEHTHTAPQLAADLTNAVILPSNETNPIGLCFLYVPSCLF